jgi:D-3-phosphoglycerate dehydrogenase
MADQRIVLLTDRPWPDARLEREILATVGAMLVEPRDSSPEAIAELAPQADAIGVCWAPLPGELLARCPRCRIVARFGVGLDNIPVDVATRLGIPVTYLPDYCVREVADHTLALVLALLRDVIGFDRSLKEGLYDPNRFVPRRFDELTLGLVGDGRIARAVAERAAGFGFNLIVTSRSSEKRRSAAKWVGLEELLQMADVVSLHLPLSIETRHLINRQRLALMKPTTYLVNTSRGGLIDSAALVEALDAGRLAGAGLDVFETEPPLPHDPVVMHPRIIATPHVAFRSAESLVELRTRGARQIADVLDGHIPEFVVNPQVLNGGAMNSRYSK